MTGVKMDEIYRSLEEEAFVGDGVNLVKRVIDICYIYDVRGKKVQLWEDVVKKIAALPSFEGNKSLLEDVVYDSAEAFNDQIINCEDCVSDVVYRFLRGLVGKAEDCVYGADVVVDKWLYGAIKSFDYPGPIVIKGFVNEFHAHEIHKYYLSDHHYGKGIPYTEFISKYTKWKKGELIL